MTGWGCARTVHVLMCQESGTLPGEWSAESDD